MEQQDIASSTQPANPNSPRDTPQRPRPLGTPHSAQHELSTSEPTLRFPRPQGNRHLANWISSSNPDIMRLASTATDDVGLSESTYELISGTDSESQDGNYTESMGESVGSLDFHRPDDVHSLAGTEHTHDDESVLDDTELQPEPATGSAVIVEAEDDDDDAQDDANNEQTDAVDSESDDEARSRCSLEYTQQSLKTPSISTPEASKILSPAVSLDDCYPTTTEFLGGLCRSIWTSTASALPPLIFGAALVLIFHTLYPQASQTDIGQVAPPLASSEHAIVPTTTHELCSSKPSTALRPTATPPGGVGLVALDNPASDDWLFGAKPDIRFRVESPGEVMVVIPPIVKKAWLSKSCLEVVATRNNDEVGLDTSFVDSGMLIKFPKKERHGVVTLTLKATCRPKSHKVVKVHFGKGIMEEALEMTRHLVLDLGELVPAAAQEAERRLGNAKRSLERASDNLGQTAHSLSGKMAGAVSTHLSAARQSLKGAKKEMMGTVSSVAIAATRNVNELAEQVARNIPSVAEAQDQFQLGLLNAQISAKLWWLKVTSRTEEHGEYQRKARDFLASKLAEAETKYAATKPASTARSWSKVLRRRRCKPTAGRGRRGVQQCIPEE